MEAQEFRRLRKAARMTQREVSGLLLITERTVNRWETGTGKIPRIKADWIRVMLKSKTLKKGA